VNQMENVPVDAVAVHPEKLGCVENVCCCHSACIRQVFAPTRCPGIQ
jgi:hypothetical protein